MYCSGCGTQIQSGLNYCSRCGRRVAEELAAGSWTSNPMTIVACIAGVGFFMFMLVVRMITRSDFPPNILVPLAFVYFAAMFGICFMVLRYGSKPIPEPIADRNFDTGELREPAYLTPMTTAQLHETRDVGIGSVTDATTRTLDKVARK